MVNIVFLHPDLGIGGAERLVIDAALALQSKGHRVDIVTSHHDSNHCFPETKDGTLSVKVVGDWLPRSIFGRFIALCAYLRMLYAAFYIVFQKEPHPHVFFCDQVSICIPVLRAFTKAPVLFYCHFPDLLLASHRSWVQKLYRAPLDWLEEKTTGLSTAIVVNSQFTAGIFEDTFQSIRRRPQVLYPSLSFDKFDQPFNPTLSSITGFSEPKFVCLSINRYERKKNLALALQAFALLLEDSKLTDIHLIMAGGYDERLQENVEHFQELKSLSESLHVQKQITFLRSPNDEVKSCLLHSSQCLLYTPDKEHFGIVPLEAMYCRLPVIAVNSGGPLETVEDHRTGYLCEPKPEDFAAKMKHLYENRSLVKEMGERGRQRVQNYFSFASFSDQLNELIIGLIDSKSE